jgi:hypothetical protein
MDLGAITYENWEWINLAQEEDIWTLVNMVMGSWVP